MGKKPIINQASTSKSSKIEGKRKQPANCLLKVLRPRVYITDSSSFKQLVQDLTGNGTTNLSSLSASPSPLPSPSSSSSSSPPLPVIVTVEDRACLEDSSSEDNSASQMLSEISPDDNPLSSPCDLDYASFYTAYKGFDFTYEDIESWLLDMETGASAVPVFHDTELADVSIYDYEFSGL